MMHKTGYYKQLPSFGSGGVTGPQGATGAQGATGPTLPVQELPSGESLSNILITNDGNVYETTALQYYGGTGTYGLTGTTGITGPYFLANSSIYPTQDSVYSLGTTGFKFKDLYLSNGTLIMGDATMSAEGDKFVVSGMVPKSATSTIGTVDQPFESMYLSSGTLYLGDASISSSGTAVQLPLGTTVGGINPGTIIIYGAVNTSADLPASGNIGDGYIVTGGVPGNAHLWVCTTSGEVDAQYTDVGVIQGPMGPQGYTGPQGFQGHQGPTGFQGSTGFQGPTGFQGSTGVGVTGATGDIGVTGPQGFQGASGSGGTNLSAPAYKNDILIGTTAGGQWVPSSSVNGNVQGDCIYIGQGSGGTTGAGTFGTIGIGTSAAASGQNQYAVAIGTSAGSLSQGGYAVSVGNGAGYTTQADYAVAVGAYAGYSVQGNHSVAIGVNAGNTNLPRNSIAIGFGAGYSWNRTFAYELRNIAIGENAGATNQGGTNGVAIAIGYNAGRISQENACIAIGSLAGNTSQGVESVAIGRSAGQTSQTTASVAIGGYAASSNQGIFATAVGYAAGNSSQGGSAVALGAQAGGSTQGTGAVHVGRLAGNSSAGAYSIGIGYAAGETGQPANTIILNATGSTFSGTAGQTGALYVDPVRAETTTEKTLQYNTTTKEITYKNDVAIGTTISASKSVAITNNTEMNIITAGTATTVFNALSNGTWKFGVSCNNSSGANPLTLAQLYYGTITGGTCLNGSTGKVNTNALIVQTTDSASYTRICYPEMIIQTTGNGTTGLQVLFLGSYSGSQPTVTFTMYAVKLA